MGKSNLQTSTESKMWYEAAAPGVALFAIWKIYELCGTGFMRQRYRGLTDPRCPPEYAGCFKNCDFQQEMYERDRNMQVDPFKFKWLDREWRPLTEIKKPYDS